MSYEDCELPEFYRTSEPVAKADRRCCECKAPIMAGEEYVYCVGKWDGDLNSYSQHESCAQACEFIRDMQGGECIGFGSLKEWHQDMKWNYKKSDDNHREIRKMLAAIIRRERGPKP